MKFLFIFYQVVFAKNNFEITYDSITDSIPNFDTCSREINFGARRISGKSRVKAKKNTWPWLVRFEIEKKSLGNFTLIRPYRDLCGGVIISDNLILTGKTP